MVRDEEVGLARRLGLADAVWIGLGSMIGAGVFSVWAPAEASAGSLLLVALFIAAVVAFCNATSSAQLAAQYPTSGGTYVYGRERLGEWPGFLAGWGFVIGKTASCAAMAMTFAAFVAPEGWAKPVAIAAVLVLVGVNYVGVTKTAAVTKAIVVIVLAVLAWALGVAFFGPPTASFGWLPDATPYGVLQAAGLLFFAFAGYARIATLGEEVRDPQRTIPRAIVIAFVIALALYALVGWQWHQLDWSSPVLAVGAALASLGALLGLIAGVGRTVLAMARCGDLPRALDAVHPRFRTPHRAEITVAVIVSVVLVFADLRGAIGFSSFGVLLYYFVANSSAFTQDDSHRRYPRWLQVLGALGCGVLVVTLPWQSVVGGVAVLAVGVVVRRALRRKVA